MSESEQAAAPAPPAVSPVKAELDKLRTAHHDAIVAVEEAPERDMFWVEVRPQSIVGVCKLLRDDPQFDYKLLADLTCVDRPWEERRLCVIYNLYSITRRKRIILRVRLADGESVPTVSGVWPAANWAEREVFDLFGVIFDHHPNLTRIELPEDWDGHPLRKDYPAVGKKPVLLFNDVQDVL